MDQLKSMRLFTRIVELGSFSGVARETGLAQPTISKMVAALENRLGTQLLNRTTREVKPTETGNRYYRECRNVLEAVDQLEGSVNRLQAQPSGLLRLSVPTSFGRFYAVSRIVAFLEKNPHLRIVLAMNNHRVDLIREGFDLAIVTGRLSDSHLIARKIGRNDRVLVATPGYLNEHGRPQTPLDLSRHNCIVTEEPWQLQGMQEFEQVAISGNLWVNNSDGVREAVLLSLGIGLAPLWAVQSEIKCGALEIVLPKHNPVTKDIFAVYPYTRTPVSKIEAFIAFLKEDLKRISFLT
jgi:DNA-binding transcriptional LysR family regulator